jgi:hypothetical protein
MGVARSHGSSAFNTHSGKRRVFSADIPDIDFTFNTLFKGNLLAFHHTPILFSTPFSWETMLVAASATPVFQARNFHGMNIGVNGVLNTV